jgi:hypothetical protein
MSTSQPRPDIEPEGAVGAVEHRAPLRPVGGPGSLPSSPMMRAADLTWGVDRLTVLGYHRVAEADPDAAPGLISATPEQFAAQMDHVQRWFTPIALMDLLDYVIEGRRLPERPLLITFDDGYRDNFDVALPVLRARGLPAVLFVTTGLVDSAGLPWWDRAWRALERCRRPAAELPEIGPVELGGADGRRRR